MPRTINGAIAPPIELPLSNSAVAKALKALDDLQHFNFFNGFDLFFISLNDFFTSFNDAVTQEALAVQANGDAQNVLNNPQNDPLFVRNVLSDRNKAGGQMGLAQVAQTQANGDIAAAKAANDAANKGDTGTGDNHDGDDNDDKRPGGGNHG